MNQMVELEDVTASREQLGTTGSEIWRTWFLKPAAGTRLPQAFLVEYAPGRVLRTHFHDVDEFQIVVSGSGTFGSHDVVPFTVHFARAHTPYGPIVAGPSGLAFLTLRAQRDSSGPQKLPEMREALENVRGRRPFQVAGSARRNDAIDSVVVQPLEGFHGDGLAAHSLELPERTRLLVPKAANSGPQFIAVVAGSVTIDARALHAPAIVYLPPQSAPLHVQALHEASHVLVLSFPEGRVVDEAGDYEEAASSGAAPDEQWICGLCGFIYRESVGQPHRGIPAGTPWDALPQGWRCDDCDAHRADFLRVDPLSAR